MTDRNITAAATIAGQSLNSWVSTQLEEAVKTALSTANVRARRRLAPAKKKTAKRNRQHA